MADWFGSTWTTLGGIVLTTVAFYLTTLASVRVAGRRTLAQMSAFDVVITIALGSLLATTVVSRKPAYAHAVTALLTLLALQIALGAARQRSRAVRQLLDFEPLVVVRDGQVHLPKSPLGAQITHGELMAKLRQSGIVSMDEVSLVVVEPTGEISVVRASSAGKAEALVPAESEPYRPRAGSDTARP